LNRQWVNHILHFNNRVNDRLCCHCIRACAAYTLLNVTNNVSQKEICTNTTWVQRVHNNTFWVKQLCVTVKFSCTTRGYFVT